MGGYRRGKTDSGDMDFILSHPDENITQNFIGHLLDILTDSGWVLHELTVSYRGSGRKQETLAWRGADGRRKPGSGFDTLDHAFVVWRNPGTPPKAKEKAKAKDAGDGGNDEEEGDLEYPYRRVDIIISPWKTAGCAVLGWTGGTLFERDLRSYCRNVKGWKFDSSGVRSRRTGEEVLLEGPEGVDGTPEEAEKMVFRGLGLEFVPPDMRVTY